MLFPTLDFAIFFLVVFAIAWELNKRPEYRKAFLLGASYFFYGYWDWRFTALLAGSSLLNYATGRFLALTDDDHQRRILVGTAVGLNLIVLGFFKYYGFFLDSLADILLRVGLERDLLFLEIILPVGISFFTFQGISYVVDVYRREIPPADSALDIFLYISFFPQLVAGPIVRAADFLPQLWQKPRLERSMISLGIVLILTGLFKKMVIANYLASELVDTVFFDPSAYGGIDLSIALYGYAIQIYCDFSGYSDIAIGVAALLGYRFKWNFNQPYRAASLREFWHRWHISLSQWLRDYLYKPLGGSQNGSFKTYRNLLLTMFLGGIWHGAAWTFVVWGLVHGSALAIERLISGIRGAPAPALAIVGYGHGPTGQLLSVGAAGQNIFNRMVCTLITFHVVCLAWIFFRAENFSFALDYLAGLLDWSEPALFASPFLVAMIALSLCAHFVPETLVEQTAKKLEWLGTVGLGLLLGFGVLLIEAIAPEGVAPFIYFQF